MRARPIRRNRAMRLSARRFDHAANALAMADLSAETEVVRRGLHVDGAARSLGL
jgi:hypothetical protein